MKAIPVTMLREGLVFSEPVYIEEDNLLVPAGIKIRKKDLEQLRAWDIHTVYSDGGPVTAANLAPEQPAVEQKQAPLSLASEEGSETYRSYQDAIRRLNSVFTDISEEKTADPHAIDSIAGDLYQDITQHRESMASYILGAETSNYERAKSSVNTAILAALISADLKFSSYRLLQIITGALLHDVGMFKLSGEITAKRGGLSAEELQEMRRHPLYGYQVVCKELRYPEEVGAIVLQHHEHWDGQGYPRRIAGADIDTGARIISVVDAFEAMVSQKPYRNPMAGYQAIKNLLADNSRCFDPEILKAFVKVMGVYPIGSLVLLNNRVTARVVDVQPKSPLRPKIRVLIDESGKGYPSNSRRIIDLLTEKTLFITQALDPRDVIKKNG